MLAAQQQVVAPCFNAEGIIEKGLAQTDVQEIERTLANAVLCISPALIGEVGSELEPGRQREDIVQRADENRIVIRAALSGGIEREPLFPQHHAGIGMPQAYRGRGGEHGSEDGHAVAVDVVDEGDGGLPFHRHAPVEDVVARHLVAQHRLEETPDARGSEVVRDAWLQQRVARLPGEAVGVSHVVAQLAVRGPLRLGGIAQLELYLAQLSGQGGVGEEVVIRPALSGDILTAFVIIEVIVLEADARAQLSPAQTAEAHGVTVLHEARQVLLADAAEGGAHVAFGVDVVIVAVGVGVFAADAEVAAPQRMGERGLGGGQLVVHVVDGGHLAVGMVLAVFCVERTMGIDRTVIIGIPFQLSLANLPGIVGVERVFGTEVSFPIDVGMQDVVGQAVGQDFAVEDAALGVAQRLADVVAQADGVAVVEVVVEADAPAQFAGFLIGPLVVALCPQGVGPGGLVQDILLAVGRLAESNHAEDVQAVVPVVHVGLLHEIGVLRLVVRTAQADAEAVALPLHRPDAHHRAHRGIVLRARVQHQFHIADVLGRELVQFCPVAHLPPVDINEGRALAEHLEAVLLPLQAGDACQDVFRRTCLAEDGALHGGGQRVVLHAGNGQCTLHHHLAQQRGIRLQTKRTHFARCTPIIYTHITHAGNTQQAFLARGVLQLERTVLAAHHARHVG